MSLAVDSAEVIDLYGRAQAPVVAESREAVDPGGGAPAGAQAAPLNLTLPSEREQHAARSLVSAPRARYSMADGLKATAKIGVGTAAGVAAVAKMYPGQPDKIMHATAGGIAAGVAAEYVRHETGDPIKAALAGVLAAIGAGLAKEAVDAVTARTLGFGNANRQDFIATAVGGIPVSLIYTFNF